MFNSDDSRVAIPLQMRQSLCGFSGLGARTRGWTMRARTNITAGNKVAQLIAAAAAEGVTLASSVAVGVGWLGAKFGHF